MIEIFDDGETTPEQKAKFEAAFQALMFGTGVLKVTPAHDKADFDIGLRHKLPVIDVLRQNEHAVIASPELMPTVNVQPLPSSSVWIATETERSPRTKLRKR